MPENIFRFNSNEKQKKFFKASVIFFIAVFIGILIYSIIHLIVNVDKTATIKILVAPSDATVIIDGKTVKTEGDLKIEPGTYAVKIEKTGFISYNGSIEAIADNISYLYEYLNEEDENGTFYQDNEKEASRTQHISDKKADLFHESYTGTDNIWNITPYNDYKAGYKIFAEKSEEGKILVTIYLYTCQNDRLEKLKKSALEYLEENKIDLKKYEIKYSSCAKNP